jgi:signal transduction histidine kinase
MEVGQVIIIAVISGILFMFGLFFVIAGLAFSFRKKRILEKKEFEMKLKNKELEKMAAVVQALEQERTKISRNIHDEVGAILTLAQHNMKNVVNGIDQDSDLFDDAQFALDVLDQSVVKLRSIVHGMVPHYLMKFGLLKSYQRLSDQTNKSVEGGCVFTSTIDEDFKLEEQQEIHFYSITLELINNLLKHARPKHVTMELTTREGFLLLTIKHDGVAISQADYTYLLQHADGMGLESITNRLRIISGELRYQRKNHGGSVELAVPLTNSTKPNTYVEIEE